MQESEIPQNANDALRHNRDLLFALSRTALVVQQARTVEALFQAVGNEIMALGGHATILTVQEDQKTLCVSYISYESGLARFAGQFKGRSPSGYCFTDEPNSVFARSLSTGNSEFVHWTEADIASMLPADLHALAGTIKSAFNFDESILSPLRVDGEILGFFVLSGLLLTENDVPAVDSFASQIAVGLKNVQLLQKLQEELDARRRVEESLSHNRNLLLALSRAAQSIQKVRTQQEIYQVVGEQIQALGFDATILMLNSEQTHLCLEFTTLSNNILKYAEKVTGLKVEGYSWPITDETEYERIIAAGRAEYIAWSGDLFSAALPRALRPLSAQLMRMLRTEHGIIAPLHVDEGNLGLLIVFGSPKLSEVELPAVDSFAGQIAVALQNARLAQQAEQELAERKQAEEAIARHERYFKAFIENATDGILVVGLDGKIKYESPSVTRLLGYSPNALVGQNAFDFIAPDDLPNVMEQFAQGLSTPGYVQRCEYRLLHASGEPRHFEIFSHYLMEDPVINGIIINGRDISERKHAEAALRESEERYRVLYNDNPSMYFTADAEGLIVSVNKYGISQLGYESGDLVGRTLLDIFHPDDRDAVQKQIAVCLENPGQMIQIEARKIHKDGTQIWVRESACAVTDTQGRAVVLLVCDDVTAQKQAAAALQKSEQAYRTLFENMPIGLYRTSIEGQILDANPALVRMFGYPDRNSLLGVKASSLYLDPESNERFLVDIKEKGVLAGFEAQFLRYDGTSFWAEDFVRVISDDDGTPLFYEGSLIDTTERKQAEAELLESKLRFQRLADNAPDIIFRYNIQPTMQLSYINSAVQWVTGYTPDECYADPNLMLNMIHPEDYGIMLGYIQSLVPPKGPMFLRWIGKDGATRWMESRVVPIMDSDGQLTAVEGVTRDITERKLAEDALRESESRFHSIVTESADGIALIDEAGRVIEFNDAVEEITGYKREAFLGLPVWDMQFQFTPRTVRSAEIYEKTKEMFTKALKSGQALFLNKTLEVPLERADGTIRFIQMRVFSVQTEKGWRLGNISRDVTENKQAEEALHKQLAILSSLYQMTAALGQTTELEEIFSYALDSLQNTLAAKRAAVLLFDPDGVIRFKSWRGLAEAYRNVVEGHAPWKRDAKDPQPVLVPDVKVAPNFAHLLPALEAEGIASMGFIPLVHQEKLLGKLMIYYDDAHEFSNDEVQLAQTIARYVSFAIGRKLAEDELRFANASLKVAHYELKEMFEHEQVLARTDVLTGQCNRRYFFELAMREFEASIRYRRPLTIILFDVDDFKQANDSFGHAVGDEILKSIAMIAASQIRSVDVLARYGGDEFIILLPETHAEQAFLIAERIRVAVVSNPIKAEGRAVIITNSIGVAEIKNSPEDQYIEDVIRRADKALYKAKELGRNHTFIYREEERE